MPEYTPVAAHRCPWSCALWLKVQSSSLLWKTRWGTRTLFLFITGQLILSSYIDSQGPFETLSQARILKASNIEDMTGKTVATAVEMRVSGGSGCRGGLIFSKEIRRLHPAHGGDPRSLQLVARYDDAGRSQFFEQNRQGHLAVRPFRAR